jgi:hypothetical protein
MTTKKTIITTFSVADRCAALLSFLIALKFIIEDKQQSHAPGAFKRPYCRFEDIITFKACAYEIQVGCDRLKQVIS